MFVCCILKIITMYPCTFLLVNRRSRDQHVVDKKTIKRRKWENQFKHFPTLWSANNRQLIYWNPLFSSLPTFEIEIKWLVQRRLQFVDNFYYFKNYFQTKHFDPNCKRKKCWSWKLKNYRPSCNSLGFKFTMLHWFLLKL